jgi:hypothetical protein
VTVLTFQPRFVPKVEAKTKLQTIRGVRKRPIKVGDMLSLRTWTGRPYNSPQRILLPDVPCTRTCRVMINFDRIIYRDETEIAVIERASCGGHSDLNEEARKDGFESWIDLISWFDGNHALPFEGVLIGWGT